MILSRYQRISAKDGENNQPPTPHMLIIRMAMGGVLVSGSRGWVPAATSHDSIQEVQSERGAAYFGVSR